MSVTQSYGEVTLEISDAAGSNCYPNVAQHQKNLNSTLFRIFRVMIRKYNFSKTLKIAFDVTCYSGVSVVV